MLIISDQWDYIFLNFIKKCMVILYYKENKATKN